MATRIRSFDWAATSLGPISRWPQSLKTIVDLMLGSPSMMSLVWGREAIHLYNDSFTELLKEHRTVALGRSAFETFARSSYAFEADVAAGMAGKSARLLGQRCPVLRSGRLEDAWFDVDYAPIRSESGAVAGVLWTLKERTSQKLAEQALRISEAHHRLLIESWAQAVWEADAGGVVVDDSPSWRAYTGQTVDEWLGYGWINAIHPDDRAYAERQWREAIATRGLVNAEFRLRAPDGGWRWTNIRAAPVLDPEGRIEKWAGMSIDIDARKRAEEALLASENKYRTLFESIDEGFCVLELLYDEGGAPRDCRYVQVNPAFLKQTGQEDPTGKLGSEYVPASAPMWLATYDAVVRSGDPVRFEQYHPDSGRWYSVYASIIGERGSRLVASVFADVTEPKRAAAALRESEERQRALIEGVPQLVWRAVDGGRWTWASPQWTAFTGQSELESHDWGWLDPIHPEDRVLAREAWSRAGDTGALAVEYRVYHTSEHRYRWFQTRATPVRDQSGTITEWLGTSTDVDDLRSMQERQRVMVAELQHRTRNLIAVVRSIAQQTMATSRDLESFRDTFNERLAALSRVQGLLSRSEQERITIGSLLRVELDALGAGELADRISLSGPNIPLRNSIVQTLALALHELATNARKYGALANGRGRLDVSWEVHTDTRERRRLKVTWAESGVVIPPDVQDTASQLGGYGRELIERALPYALGATTTHEITADGVRCTIDLPLDKRASQQG